MCVYMQWDTKSAYSVYIHAVGYKECIQCVYTCNGMQRVHTVCVYMQWDTQSAYSVCIHLYMKCGRGLSRVACQSCLSESLNMKEELTVG